MASDTVQAPPTPHPGEAAASAGSPGRRRPRRIGRLHWASHTFLAVYSVIVLVPLLFVVYLSIKTVAGILGTPLSLPTRVHTENYSQAWVQGDLGQFLLNTLIVAVVSVAAILVFASFPAYVIARYKFRGNQLLYLFFISGMALPVQIIALPIFVLMEALGLLNSLTSLILVYAASGISFSVFLFVNFMRGIPNELQEAALVDGAGPIRIYWHIILPLIRPVIAIVAIFQFLTAWKDFFIPLILIQDQSKMTVGVGVLTFVGQYTTQWQLLLAGLVIVSVPSVIGFLIVAKQFRRNLMSGGVKM